jgi:hypothetical protein
MKIRVPVLVKDPEVTKWKDIPLTEDFTIEGEGFFLDGPTTRRVAMLDFDTRTGALRKGARFLPPAQDDRPGRYALPQPGELQDDAFIQVTVFGGVYKTMRMFEEADTLGRAVTWAFPGPQLLVVPRAGEWANAFYERDSHSIQLFYFTPEGRHDPVFTCHSQDIIAHETAHAIIDGAAPDLYDATAPQSLALHESLADLTTVLMAFRSRKLAAKVLDQTGGSIHDSSAFTAVAEQFGAALRANRHALRDLRNQRTMHDPDLDRGEPHALSEVLSGALYEVMVRIHDELKGLPDADEAPQSRVAVRAEFEQWAQSSDPSVQQYRSGDRRRAAAGRALWVGSERFKRTLLRGLDYLPPGEVGFADFGRAVLSSDQASHPDSAEQRQWLVEEFVRRGIVDDAGELQVRTNYEHPAIARLDLDELVRSDWLAYQFADRWRSLLNIPRRIPFEVRPRLQVTKTYYHRNDKPREVTECLFKVSWTETEACRVGGGVAPMRRVVRGTTLAIDWHQRLVRAVVTGQASPAMAEAREAFLARLLARGELKLGGEALAPDGKPLRSVIRGDIVENTLRVRSTARALHVLEAR